MKLPKGPGRRGRRPRVRGGAAAVELALLLPLLCLIMAIIVDYARLMADQITVTDCARRGAMYAADSKLAAEMPYESIAEAALADAGHLDPPPSVTSAAGVDARGTAYVDVTVEYTFRTLVGYPGVPQSTRLRKTIRMPVRPS